MSKKTGHNSDQEGHIVILVCDNVPNQKFWNTFLKDWVLFLEEATVYKNYGAAMRCIWKEIPDDQVSHRITSSNKELYKRLLSGEWDGYSKFKS